MTPEQSAQLRATFLPEQVGKLPRVWCKKCSDNKVERHCPEHKLVKCPECGNRITEAHLHLAFVGHAAVTDRIISVDPDYEFGPVLDINKRPIKSEDGSVLYSLTIGGSTKYEWGDGPNMKEISSDAIRRCAMRFGVALDLWAKEPLHAEEADPSPKKAARAKRPVQATPAAAPLTPEAKRIVIAAKEAAIDEDLRHRITRRIAGVTSAKDVPPDMVDKVIAAIKWLHDYPESIRKLEEWERENGVVAA